MIETAYEIAKMGVGLIASLGADAIVSDVMIKVMPKAISKTGKLMRTVGAFAIGGVAGSAAYQYMDESADIIKDVYTDIKETITKKKEEEDKLNETEEDEDSLRVQYEALKERFETEEA